MIDSLDWIAVDWGSTHIRAMAMGAGGVLARAEGRNTATPGAGPHEAVLLALVGDWLGAGRPMPVLACGMVGARHGWAEAPYRPVPALLDGTGGLTPATTADVRLTVRIVPGLSQDLPADVMRGEETQIAGFLADRPGFDGVLCLPGTHTKWVHVSAREVVSFRTAMTGEMFALLAGQSVLRHTVAGEGHDAAAFAEAVAQTMSRPERMAADLFTLRAEGLLHGLDAGVARSRLSGLLIGAELAAMRPYWLGQAVVIIGEGAVSSAYAEALAAQGVAAECLDGSDMSLKGLQAMWTQLQGGAA